MEEHIKKSIQPGKIILTCEVCCAENKINTLSNVSEIDRETDDFRTRHEHLGRRGIDYHSVSRAA